MAAVDIVRRFFPNVTTVIDANRNTMIEVTRGDAASKAVKSHSACAMAVACKRKFHLDGVIISRSVAYLVKGNRARRFKLPETVSREIVSFDRGGGFAVGKYELGKIPPATRLGAGGKKKPGSHNKGEPKKFRHMTTNVRSVLGGKKPEEN